MFWTPKEKKTVKIHWLYSEHKHFKSNFLIIWKKKYVIIRFEGMQKIGLCRFCNNTLDDLTIGIIKSGKTSNSRGSFSKCS